MDEGHVGMPGVLIRGWFGRRVERWYYRHRSQVAVTAAFIVAGLLGLAAASVGFRDAPPPPSPANGISAPQ